MAAYNRVILCGNLTRDPEVKVVGDGISLCNFGLAVNRVRSKNDEVDFFDITAWRELGETIANYKKKGDPVLVEGKLQYRTWEAEDGSKRSKVDVVADSVQFLGRGNSDGDGASGSSGETASRGGKPKNVEVNEEDFDDIPFRHFSSKAKIAESIL